MVSLYKNLSEAEIEELVAELTDAAYRVALRHQSRGTIIEGEPTEHEGFIKVELELWKALRGVLRRAPVVTGGEAA